MADETATAGPKPARVTVAQRTRAQTGEYGHWVATVEVRTGTGALAYAPGHPVPASNVDGGRVVLARHQCDGSPDCGGSPDARCERFNEPTEWSDDGMIREG